MTTPATDRISAVAALNEPTRRALYEYVVQARVAVSRDQASQALGVSRATAAFHLDKLADEGLLEVTHERLTGRTGPGAGRPAKLYHRPETTVAISLPQRSYELAGDLLAHAVEDADGAGCTVREALGRRARSAGQSLGATAPRDTVAVLRKSGFEPLEVDGTVRLGNCPFHALARRHTDLVCSMNLELLSGVLEGAGDTAYSPRLDPQPGHCCVVLEPREP